MLGRFFALFRGRGMIIKGTSKLPEGEARTVEIGDVVAGGVQAVLCRVEGRLYALDAVCPHEQGRITPGPLVEGKFALCPLHNYKFDPKNGASVNARCRSAKTYRIVEKDGDAEIWV